MTRSSSGAAAWASWAACEASIQLASSGSARAWAACGIQFGRIMLGPSAASAGPQAGASAHSASAPPPASPQPGGPVLPSLGGGSFPPIDPK